MDEQRERFPQRGMDEKRQRVGRKNPRERIPDIVSHDKRMKPRLDRMPIQGNEIEDEVRREGPCRDKASPLICERALQQHECELKRDICAKTCGYCNDNGDVEQIPQQMQREGGRDF